METINMTIKETDRLKIVDRIMQGQISQQTASIMMDLSTRQVRRILKEYRGYGAKGLLHKSRGRPSNNRLEEDKRQKIIDYITQKEHRDFSAVFAQEKLEVQGIKVSVNTVWKLQLAEKVRKKKKHKKRHLKWRTRRSYVGELVQIDGSIHAWLEDRGPKFVLINMIDDATSEILYTEFVKSEDTRNLMMTMKKYIKKHGRPVSIYVDKDSIYRVNREPSIARQLAGKESITQFGRAMEELDIELICANSSQAKGRVERSFKTDQDRLVKEMRLLKISTLEAANEYLQKVYMAERNRKYAKKPLNSVDVHREIGEGRDIEKILSLKEERTIRNDNVISYKTNLYQINPTKGVLIRSKQKVEVIESTDGEITIERNGTKLNYERINRNKIAKSRTPKSGKEIEQKAPWKPAADHPWRNGSYNSPTPVATLPTLVNYEKEE